MSKKNYFKIVETIENGKSLLSAVPQQWEANGILTWPPESKKQKFLRKAWDPPGSIEEGWTHHNCIVKRSFIPTYSQALNEIKMMSDMSDTTDSASNASSPSIRKLSAIGRKIIPVLKNPDDQRLNFNEFQAQFQPMNLRAQEEPENEHRVQEMNQNVESTRQNIEERIHIDMESKICSLVTTVAQLKIRLEHSIALQESILVKLNSGCQIKESQEEFYFEPIDNINDLNDFEQQLNKKEFVDNLFRKLCTICGPKSGQRGDNISYRIVDSLFTRRLFTLVSWSGVSRTKQNENFIRFVNTFKFFHNLVKYCDSTYFETELKAFFQKIINNSKRRYEIVCNNAPKRLSTTKHHTAKRNLNTQNMNENPQSQAMDDQDCDEFNTDEYIEEEYEILEHSTDRVHVEQFD